jgi:hypothetical protein
MDISLSWNQPEDSTLVGKNNPLFDIVSDCHLYNYAFCKDQRFSEAQSSVFLSIMKTILDKDDDAGTDISLSYDRFQHLLMRESIDRPPHSVQVFTAAEARAIVAYVTDSYYRHFNLYQFNFTRKITTVLVQTNSNGIDPVKLARPLRVAQLDKLELPSDADTPSGAGTEMEECPVSEIDSEEEEEDEWAGKHGNKTATGSPVAAVRAKRAGKIQSMKNEW